MIDGILDSVAPELTAGGIRLDRSRILCTLYSNRGPVTSSVVAFVFSGTERAPRLVVKLSQQPATLHREYRALQRIAEYLPGRVPRAFGCGETLGIGYLAMESVDAPGIPPGRFERHALEIVAAIGDVHEHVREGHLEGAERQHALRASLVPFSAWCDGNAPELRPLAATLGDELTRLDGVPLPRIPQHGDFVLNHVLPRRGAGLAIIDWEEFGTVIVPGYDVTVLFATLVGRSALGEPGLRRLLADAWTRYATHLGLDRRWPRVLVPLHLIVFLLFCLAEGRERPARMILTQLRHWVDGRGRDLWGEETHARVPRR